MALGAVTVYEALGQVITANGNSGDLAVAGLKYAVLTVDATAVSGTTPTLDVYLDRKGPDGNYLAIAHLTQITSVEDEEASVGPGLTNTEMLGETVRIRWVVGGTTPSFTASISLVGE